MTPPNKSTEDDVSDDVKLFIEKWQAAESRAAEYKNTAEAAIDAHQRALAQVDALTMERDEFAAEHIKRGLAATARCERYEKALQEITAYWCVCKKCAREHKALAEQALANVNPECKAPTKQCGDPHWCKLEGECLYPKWHPEQALADDEVR